MHFNKGRGEGDSAPSTRVRDPLMDAVLSLGLRAVPCAAVVFAIAPAGRLFSWHPFLMSVAFVACVSTGVDAKRSARGKGPTLVHAVCMSAALVMAMAGVVVVAVHKQNVGHSHLNTAHSRFGAAAVSMLVGTWGVGSFALRLDAPPSSAWRPVHRTIGKCAIILASVSLATGWSVMVPSSASSSVAATLIAAWIAWRNCWTSESTPSTRALLL